MTTFLLFGKYSKESLKSIDPKRTNKAAALIKKHGGFLKGGYALLGKVDIVLIVELPDLGEAMKVSVALTKLTGIAFHTEPALSIEDFDKLMK